MKKKKIGIVVATGGVTAAPAGTSININWPFNQSINHGITVKS